MEEHGPFKSLRLLLEHPGHVAVFLNYLFTNAQPASLLFYLITDIYRDGNLKDMRRWAYEIHSTFLVPGAVSLTIILHFFSLDFFIKIRSIF